MMFKQNTRTLTLSLVAILIGCIGAIGQAYMLHHELADCYPYKIVNWSFYNDIAQVGIYFAPFIAISFGIFFNFKRFWLMSVIPVVLCPLLFSIVFISFSLFRVDENIEWFFDGQTTTGATLSFVSYSVKLSLVGFIIGGICSYILKRFSVNDRLV
jgi:hypothetical protein